MKTKRNLKEIGYILWEYYRWHIFVAALILIFLFSFSFIQINKETDGFCAFVVNGNETADIAAQFSEFVEIDPAQRQVAVEYLTLYETITEESYAAMQKIVTYASSQRLDAAVMNASWFSVYAQEGLFADLRTVMTDEQLAELEENLYYIEEATLLAAMQGSAVASAVSKDASIFDSPVPIGVDLSGFDSFAKRISYSVGNPCIGIVNSSKRKDLAVRFIDFLISE